MNRILDLQRTSGGRAMLDFQIQQLVARFARAPAGGGFARPAPEPIYRPQQHRTTRPVATQRTTR